MDQEFKQRVIREINRNCAEEIRAANKRADLMIEYLNFLDKECADGCELMEAINKGSIILNDAALEKTFAALSEKAQQEMEQSK
jgi:hypothetical protein